MTEGSRRINPADIFRSFHRSGKKEAASPEIPVIPTAVSRELPSDYEDLEISLTPQAQVALDQLMNITGSSIHRIINQTLVDMAAIRGRAQELGTDHVKIVDKWGNGRRIKLHEIEPPTPENLVFFPNGNDQDDQA